MIGASASARYVKEEQESLQLRCFLLLPVPTRYEFHFPARPCSDSDSALLIRFGCSSLSPNICTNCGRYFQSRAWVSHSPQMWKQRLGELQSRVMLPYSTLSESSESEDAEDATQNGRLAMLASQLETGVKAMRPIALVLKVQSSIA